MTPEDAARLAGIRQSRQSEILDPTNSLRLVTVVEEGAIRRQVGSARIHAQIDLLAEASTNWPSST